MQNLTIYVYPVNKASKQKRHMTPVLGVNKSGGQYQVVETGHIKNYFRAEGYTPIKFLIDQRTGKYKTGLEEMIKNPLKGLAASDVKATYGLSQEWDVNDLLEKILSSDKISKQYYFEILDGQSPHTYHNEVQNNMMSIVQGAQAKTKEKSEIEKFVITLYTHGSNVFSTETSRGRLAIQCLMNQKSVAIDKQSINEGVHDWYIGAINEEEQSRQRMDSLVNDAIFELESLRRKYTDFDLYRIAVQLKTQANTPLIAGEVNASVVMDKLNRFIKTKSKRQEQDIDQFLELVQVFYKQPEKFQIDYLVQQGISSGILYSRDGAFYWRTQVNNPTWHKWRDHEMFAAKMLEESTKSLDHTNYYVIFEKDLKDTGIRTE